MLNEQNYKNKNKPETKKNLQNFIFGGIAGATSRTVVAPLDRIKIIMQTEKTNHFTITTCYRNILRNEKFVHLWKGNILNCFRIIPYSALQFGTYDMCKSQLNAVQVNERLYCGLAAGLVATTFTHPIDVIRHKLLLETSIYNVRQSIKSLLLENSYKSMFKGYGSTICSLTPFIAINFCTYDTMKTYFNAESTMEIISVGAFSALFSQSLCYPLDTIRRRMQKGGYKNGLDACNKIIQKEGFQKLYSGIFANALKIVPNNCIRFMMYEFCRRSLQ